MNKITITSFFTAAVLVITLVLSGCQEITNSIKSNHTLTDVHNGGSVIAFTNNSIILASGGWEGQIKLWITLNGKRVRTWKAHTDSVHAIIFTNRDTEITSASYDGYIKKWDLQGKLLKSVNVNDPISATAYHQKKNLLITGHRSGKIRLYRLESLRHIRTLHVQKSEIAALAYEPNLRLLATSAKNRQVKLTYLKTGKSWFLERPPSYSRTLAFYTNNGRTELLGGGWFYLFSWNTITNKLTKIKTKHQGIVKSINISPDNQTIATISRQTDSSVYLLDARSKQTKLRLHSHELCGTYIRMSPNNRYIATTSDDASIQIWDLTRMKKNMTSLASESDLSKN